MHATDRTKFPTLHNPTGAREARSAPSTLDGWTKSNSRASGPETEAEYRDRVAASRRGGVVFLAGVFGLWLAWIVGRAVWFAL
jgi:hypothetical protein